MGRTRAAQRQKKAEKAKVKLKGHATKFLPKGKNVTDTTFKVRKIVLQEQLKTPDGTQPLTRKKLNLKEILSRLQHYSTSQREEGLNGLSELLRQMDVGQLTSHLSSIIDNLSRLSLDGDSSVRRHSAHILTSVFSMVTETQLFPFSSVLGSYLSCAMTHIQLGIQEDSLLLLDALLEKAPALAAASSSQLLPCVLDMVSRARSDQQSTRQLSVQLSSSLTSSVWRAKVFGRLQALLAVSLLHSREQGSPVRGILNQAHHTSITVSATNIKELRFPIYNNLNATPVCLQKIFHRSSKSTKQLLNDPVQLRSFVEAIMPLMFDSWMEVNPFSSKKSKHKAQDRELHLEPALILHCVLEIIDLLWQHLTVWETDNSQHDLTDWFKETYVKDLYKFIGKGFPYAGHAGFHVENPEGQSQGHGRKHSKSSDKNISELSLLKLASPLFLKDKDEQACSQAIGKCVLQNLTLCRLLANMIKSPAVELKQKILDILISYLNHWGGGLSPWSGHLLQAIRSVFIRSSTWGSDLNPLMSAVVSRSYRSAAKKSAAHQHLALQLCDLLGEISMHQDFQHLQQCDGFQSWISQLPASVATGDLTVDKLCMFNKLASQNNAAFIQGLESAFPSLLDVVKNFQSSKADRQAEKEAGLASLFYWIPEWNNEKVSSLKAVLLASQCPSLSRKIVNLLHFRGETFESFADI